MGLDAAFAQVLLVQFAIVVTARSTHVATTQPPRGSGHDRSGYLAAETNLAGDGVGLAVAGGKVLEAQHDVGGVFADAGEVRDWNGHVVLTLSS